jgi:glycerol-3-phosphate dehydrogenase (NAD(P)+)
MKVTVIGAGGWGTALAILFYHNGHDVTLWIYDKETYDNIQAFRENKIFLAGVTIPPDIKLTNSLSEACDNSQVIVFSIPVPYLRGVLQKIKNFNFKNKVLVNSAKGLEINTQLLPHKIIKDEIPKINQSNLVTVSGPSHAEEAARGLPTNLISASKNIANAKLLARLLKSDNLKITPSKDIIGVELGAALKNIAAIALGICDGLNLGDNTKAAILIKSLDQISVLGIKAGASKDTFYGLSGLGDIVVTGFSRHSRNHFVGEEIGKGRTLEEISKGMKMIAEGVLTAKSAFLFQKKYRINLSIFTEMYKVLYENKNPKTAIEDILKK